MLEKIEIIITLHEIYFLQGNYQMSHDTTYSNRKTIDALFEENNVSQMEKIFRDKRLPLCGYYLDVALENGKEDMAKMLVLKGACQPSLYAKQMAHINGHHKLAFWMDAYSTQRNDTTIGTIYQKYDRTTKQTTWSDTIPEKYRYE